MSGSSLVRSLSSTLAAAAVIAFAPLSFAGEEGSKVTPLMSKDLSDIPGKEGMMLTVEYAPGASSAKHRHDAHTFVYVLEGSLIMQVEGGQPVTLGPGQTFYESPSDVHAVSKNASNTKPAKFVVFFIKDQGAPAVKPVR